MIKIFLALSFTMIAAANATAQPFSLDKAINPVELKLVDYTRSPDKKWNGKIAMADVTQENENSYFYVRGLSMYQPVYFTIVAEKPSDKLNVELAKNNWKKADKTGATDAKGKWKTSFRTEGSFGIKVKKSNASSKYRLMVWVGKDAANVGLSSPFK